ncbi:hypothetical protein LOAG_14043, partial [Loa loa]
YEILRLAESFNRTVNAKHSRRQISQALNLTTVQQREAALHFTVTSPLMLRLSTSANEEVLHLMRWFYAISSSYKVI